MEATMPPLINFAVMIVFGMVMFNLTKDNKHQWWILLGCIVIYLWGGLIVGLDCKP
jgi:hypothetical protein